MFEKTLSQQTKNTLALLARQKFIKNFYLAGGTALAIQIGHRNSIDLDFFTPKSFDAKKIIYNLSQLGNFNLETETWGTVSGQLNKVKITFLFYQHELLKPKKRFLGVYLADIIDIALMKITAIGSRGNKKDFIDLYLISKDILSLEKIFFILPKKFKQVKYDPYYLIRGLTYFKDADKEPMPNMFCDINWQEIKKHFKQKAIKLIKSKNVRS